MDLLEEMERQQKVLSDENLTLRRENETFASEVTRLSAILAAREQVCNCLSVPNTNAFYLSFASLQEKDLLAAASPSNAGARLVL